MYIHIYIIKFCHNAILIITNLEMSKLVFCFVSNVFFSTFIKFSTFSFFLGLRILVEEDWTDYGGQKLWR